MITTDKTTHNSNCQVEVTSVSSRDLCYFLEICVISHPQVQHYFVNTSQDKVRHHNTTSPQYTAILRAILTKVAQREAFSFICSVNIYKLPITGQALKTVPKQKDFYPCVTFSLWSVIPQRRTRDETMKSLLRNLNFTLSMATEEF